MSVIDDAAPEFFVNYFSDYEVHEGILTCTGYREVNGHRAPIVHIAMPYSGLAITRQNAAAADVRPSTMPGQVKH